MGSEYDEADEQAWGEAPPRDGLDAAIREVDPFFHPREPGPAPVEPLIAYDPTPARPWPGHAALMLGDDRRCSVDGCRLLEGEHLEPESYMAGVQAARDSISRDLVMDAIYRALVRYDREDRYVRAMRQITKRGPTIKRGTKRSALAIYLTDVVLDELRS